MVINVFMVISLLDYHYVIMVIPVTMSISGIKVISVNIHCNHRSPSNHGDQCYQNSVIIVLLVTMVISVIMVINVIMVRSISIHLVFSSLTLRALSQEI